MATVTKPDRRLRPELDGLLDRLKSRIRTYIALEGAAVVAAVVGALFWITLLFDRGWFALTNLELPVGVRATLSFAAVASIVAAFVIYAVLRLARRLRARALALVLERRFPELNDRLVLAVEHAEGLSETSDAPLQEAMLSRAIADVAVAADRLDIADVFDRRSLRRMTVAAATLMVPILLLAIARPGVIGTWWDAYGRLAENYHPRETMLRLTVLAPPDDRPRSLKPGQVYRHPRGANLSIVLDVPEGERPDGKPWVVPETVYARRRTDAGGRQTLPAVRTGDRRFLITVEEVRDGMNLWVTGGDYTNRSAYRIEVVDPPRVERVELHNLYPAYTRLNELDEQGNAVPSRVTLTGPIAEVPAGTLVVFEAKANKPIRNARVRFGDHELVFGEFDVEGASEPTRRASLVLRNETDGSPGSRVALPRDFAESLIESDGHVISIPLLIADKPAAWLPDGAQDRTDLPARPMLVTPLQTPIRVTFEDTDLVASLEPSRFELRGVADKAPEVKTELRGVSSMITRTAVVPIKGTIRDDHGIVDARFDFRMDAAEDWESRPFSNRPRGQPREFTLRRDAETPTEWLDTATLGLKLGQKLTVAIAAIDGDQLTGPNTARGDEYVFTIVSAEELLTALYNQEINLRKQFEQSLGEMKQVRQDLADHGSRVAMRDGEGEPSHDATRSAADRAFAETQQNAGEVRAIESSFEGILEQLVNNRVHTEKQLERIRTGVLQPLQRLSNERFPKLDRAVGVVRLQIADEQPTAAAFDESVVAADELIAEMEAALKEMQDLAEFHEAIQELAKIFEQEQQLLDRTEEERKRSVIDALDGLLD